MTDAIRAFIAIPMPKFVIERARRIQNEFKSRGIHMGWVEPQNVHLTLKFLGDIAAEDVDRVADVLSAAVTGVTPFELADGDMGVFPDLRRPRILWLGLTGEIARLAAFQKDIENRLYDVSQGGWKPEERRFKAHLTIGRIKTRIAPDLLIRAIREAEPTGYRGFTASAVHLIQSRLTPSGPVYAPLKRMCLDDVVERVQL